jgi:hypothetical protein
MIVLVWAIEKNLVHNHLHIQNAHGTSWAHAGNLVRRQARRCDILCFGDSTVKHGLLPRVLSDQTGRSAYNLAVLNGAPPSSYILFRRAIDAGARPSAVVVDFMQGLLAQGPASKVRSNPWADLVNFRESVELCWTARDPDLFFWITLARLFPSIKNRFEIRSFVRCRLKGEEDPASCQSLVCPRNWNQNNGAMMFPDIPFIDERPVPIGPPAPGSWVCDPTNEVYLDRFLELAEEYQIRVYWLMPPVAPVHQARFDLTGNEGRARMFMLKILRRFPNVVVIDGQHAGYGNSAFWDAVHLHCGGATALTTGVAEVIRHPPSDPRADSRWVALPFYRKPVIQSPLETYDRSSAALIDELRKNGMIRR